MFRLSLFSASGRSPPATQRRSRVGRTGRLPVHVDDLVPGHLATPARLQLTRTPLWAGIYMIPFMVGFVVSGPISGKLSDRYGARPFATAGMLLSGAMYAVMMTFPANFSYWPFAAVMFVSGIGGGLFAARTPPRS